MRFLCLQHFNHSSEILCTVVHNALNECSKHCVRKLRMVVKGLRMQLNVFSPAFSEDFHP